MSTVLIVDDDSNVLEVIASILRKFRHEALTATNAEEALGILQDKPVNLILLDVVLPGQGGMELLLDIRKKTKTIPVIIMSGKVRTELTPFKTLAQQFGATCILAKPFTAGELMEAVAVALQGSCA